MSKKNQSTRKFNFAQSCESRQCRAEFKKDIIKNFSESVITPHEYNGANKILTCLFCKKITKIK